MKRAMMCVAVLVCVNAYAMQNSFETVHVTAANEVSNVPSGFSSAFTLVRPWELDTPPFFNISNAPTNGVLTVNPLNNMPALELTTHYAVRANLSWFYYCNGLTFNYASSNPSATVMFSGKIDADHPGSNVYCTCLGSACSTTQTVHATWAMR